LENIGKMIRAPAEFAQLLKIWKKKLGQMIRGTNTKAPTKALCRSANSINVRNMA